MWFQSDTKPLRLIKTEKQNKTEKRGEKKNRKQKGIMLTNEAANIQPSVSCCIYNKSTVCFPELEEIKMKHLFSQATLLGFRVVKHWGQWRHGQQLVV